MSQKVVQHNDKVDKGGFSLPNVHVLHAHDHIIVIVQEGTVEGDNVLGMAAVHDLKFSNDSFAHFPLGFDMDDLRWS